MKNPLDHGGVRFIDAQAKHNIFMSESMALDDDLEEVPQDTEDIITSEQVKRFLNDPVWVILKDHMEKQVRNLRDQLEFGDLEEKQNNQIKGMAKALRLIMEMPVLLLQVAMQEEAQAEKSGSEPAETGEE